MPSRATTFLSTLPPNREKEQTGQETIGKTSTKDIHEDLPGNAHESPESNGSTSNALRCEVSSHNSDETSSLAMTQQQQRQQADVIAGSLEPVLLVLVQNHLLVRA